MSESMSQPRLSVEISDEQAAKLSLYIPYGFKKQVFSVIIDDLIEILESTPKREAVLAAVLNRLVSVPRRSLDNEP